MAYPSVPADPLPGRSAEPASRSAVFALLTGLYVSQFLGVGFFYTGLTAILRDRGMPLEQLSAIQALGLVWAAKFLWAPLVDRFGSAQRGHYRSWLLLLQPAIAVVLLTMVGLDPVGDFGALLLVAALVVLLSATQDIAADAIAVRALQPGDRGLGNGIQIAGGYLGNILGGGAVLVVYDRLGWPAALIALAVFTLVPTWQIWRYREPVRAADAGQVRPGFASMVTVFKAPGVARWAFGLLPSYWVGVSSAYALVTPMLVDAGWSLSTIGLVTNVIGGAIAMAGAVGSGALVRRWGRRPAMVIFGGAQIVAVLGLLPLATGTRNDVVAGVAVIGLNVAYAAASTVIHTVNMDLSRPASAGSDFTMLGSVAFGASLLAGAVSLSVAGQVGYPAVLLGAVVVIAAGMTATRFRFADRSSPPPTAAPRTSDIGAAEVPA